ncbi:hypothetical protein [Natronorubrum sp. DTA28]|uniref:hypothetical protein n=1 Tax=Natronorubrum sp. DTA28 TaxID=3447019 RepID=UPI003F87E59B
MDRRLFLQGVASGCALVTAGCAQLLSTTNSRSEPEEVFKDYTYEGTELIVEFQNEVDIQKAVLFDREKEYEIVENLSNIASFPIAFPDRLETHLSRRPPLRVKAKVEDNWVEQSVWEPVHGAVRDISILSDGAAQFTIKNLGDASLLVQFVGMYGDVPNPTINPQRDAFDPEHPDIDPNVVGIRGNRAEPTSRTDLVVSPGESAPFETINAPFAISDDSNADKWDGSDQNAQIAIAHASGGTAAYTVSFRFDGEQFEIADPH